MHRTVCGLAACTGLFISLVSGGCSFNLPARTVCSGASCSTTDLGMAPPDLLPDPDDPNIQGNYKVAVSTINTVQQSQLQTGLLYLPSDDGATLSSRKPLYPLVLLAAAAYMPDSVQLAPYAQRLASHGFIVAQYRPYNENDQVSYRSIGLGLLSYLTGGMEPLVAGHVDTTRVGLFGYDLGGAMSGAMAAQPPMVRGLFILDPQAFTAPSPGMQIDSLAELGKVTLTGTLPVVLVGEDVSKVAKFGNTCTPPQTNYEQFYAARSTNILLIDFPTAAHGDFVDNYPDVTCNGGAMAQADTTRLSMKYMTAYFLAALLDKTAAQSYLTGANFEADRQQYGLIKSSK